MTEDIVERLREQAARWQADDGPFDYDEDCAANDLNAATEIARLRVECARKDEALERLGEGPWRGMNSAPRDGTWFMAASEDHRQSHRPPGMVVVRWSDNAPFGPAWEMWHRSFTADDIFTRWRPLPPLTNEGHRGVARAAIAKAKQL